MLVIGEPWKFRMVMRPDGVPVVSLVKMHSLGGKLETYIELLPGDEDYLAAAKEAITWKALEALLEPLGRGSMTAARAMIAARESKEKDKPVREPDSFS